MICNLYIVRDSIAHTNSEISSAASDGAAERSFGFSLVKGDVPRRLASDLMLTQIGVLDDSGPFPVISGCEARPVCTGVEALDFVKECDFDYAT